MKRTTNVEMFTYGRSYHTSYILVKTNRHSYEYDTSYVYPMGRFRRFKWLDSLVRRRGAIAMKYGKIRVDLNDYMRFRV